MELALWGLLIVGLGVFVWRGPMRAVPTPQDFSLIYSEARAWLVGESPYDGDVATRMYRAAGGEGKPLVMAREDALLLYPPPGLALLAPVAALPWAAAAWVWAGVNVLSWAAAAAGVACVAGLRTRAAVIAFAAAAVWFGAAHTSITLGQTTLPTVALLAAGAWALRGGRVEWAAVAWALAAMLKPQLALPFCLYGLACGRWRFLWPAAVVGIGVVGVGVGRLALAGVAWFGPLRENLHHFTHGGHGDPTRAAAYAYQLTNLPMLLHGFTDSRAAVSIVTWGITLTLAAIYFGWTRRTMRGDRPPTDLAMLAVLAMLPFYHRYYDAAVLIFAFGLAFAIAERSRAAALLLAATLAPLLVPLPIVAHGLTPRLPEAVQTAWRVLVVASHGWTLLALAGVLCLTPGLVARREPRGAGR